MPFAPASSIGRVSSVGLGSPDSGIVGSSRNAAAIVVWSAGSWISVSTSSVLGGTLQASSEARRSSWWREVGLGQALERLEPLGLDRAGGEQQLRERPAAVPRPLTQGDGEAHGGVSRR